MKIIRKMLIIALAAGTMCLTSCQKQQAGANANEKATASADEAAAPAMKIAYIEADSILANYEFCTDHSALLEKRGNSIQATLVSKGKALENAAANFQQKVQQGGFTSQEQAMQAQAALQKQQEDLQKLQEKLGMQFEEERQKYNEEMLDSIQMFLKDYNKTHKYSIILSKKDNNILLADKQMNITNDVIKGLNKRYNATKAKKK